MKKEKLNFKKLKWSILSLSLLTVMAGAAVAPALGVIKEHFADVNPLFIQMIISIPAIFIVITNFIFPKLCEKLKSKTLVLIGLLFYTIGGCCAGLFDSIWCVLAARAIVGVGVGIIMPLSTGLLGFYFPPEEQEKLMGLSSAMNQMGGVIATLISGLLANISWSCSFLVYLMGLISIILCLIYLPNDFIVNHHSDYNEIEKNNKISDNDTRISSPNSAHNLDSVEEKSSSLHNLKKYAIFVLAMFFLMSTFFVYPANFAIETASEGIIPQSLISIIMASMDLVAFVGGLLFVTCKRKLKSNTRFLSPILFLIGYLLLAFAGGWIGTIIGSIFIGFANGEGIPYIISTASVKAGKTAVTTVMPLISASLYLAQFLSPILLSAVSSIAGNIHHLAYIYASAAALLFVITSIFIKDAEH